MTTALTLTAHRLLWPDRISGPGWVTVDGGRIVGVGVGRPLGTSVDLGDTLLTPGFLDLHCHGGGGAAFTEGTDAARRVITTHLRHGATSVMASLVTDRLDTLAGQVRPLIPLVDAGELLGIHLEGPWLSEQHCGAHDPALLRAPDPAEVGRLLDAGEGRIRMVTLAVERPGGLDSVRLLAERGVLAALGHSHADHAEAVAAIAAGTRVGTHLFNAERGIHHREPGPIPALLADPRVIVELIADGVHLHPAMLRFVADRAPGRFVLITDAMAAVGAADGRYHLGPHPVTVTDGVARLDSGTLAGSTLTLDRAVRQLVAAGVSELDALRSVTRTPADLLERSDLGRLAVGARADLVALSPDLTVRSVWRAGRSQDL